MLKQQRINTIRSLLLKEKQVSVAELARLFEVTDRTIRRDLKQLAESGVAELFFGGARFATIENNALFKQVGINNIMNALSSKYINGQNGKSPKSNHMLGVYILGSFNIDIVSEVPDFPREGETIHSLSTGFYAGGKGSNQATAAAKVNDHVHLAVKIGDDEFGSKARQYFSSTDIHSFSIFEDKETHTGNASIFVSQQSGENFIAIDLGANKTITDLELHQEYELIENSRVFLTQLENNFEATRQAIECASATGSLVMLNPAPYIDECKSIIHLVDIVTPNETEAQDMTGIEVTDIETAKQAAQAIHNMGAKVIVMTMGSKGALMFDGQQYRHFPPYKAVVTDTSGAGDSFNGALAASLANDLPLDYAIKFASAYASLAVERKGASNMPEASLAEARLTEQEKM
ncbi:PfkB family carbohydrate kinase [Photobacterium lutimaris]|nr:PfkB family carbohydrate kinase [Photobacterium lutimaris]TDR74507.1 ribokinase [Photobacterium lutimaris]